MTQPTLTPEGRKAEANERFLKIRAAIETAIASISDAMRLTADGVNLGLPGEKIDYVAEAMGGERLRHVSTSLEKVVVELRESHDAICKGKQELNGGQSDDPLDQAASVAIGTGGVSMSMVNGNKQLAATKAEKVVDKILDTAHGKKK